MNFVNILALATTVMGVAMSLSYYIQIAKIWKTKSSKDLSLMMFIIFSVGLILWLLYGIAIENVPLIIVNAISVVGVAILLGFIIKFRK